MSVKNLPTSPIIGPLLGVLLVMNVTLSSMAQTPKTDSLRKAIQSLSGKEKVDAENTLSFYLLNYSNELFVRSSDEALELSVKIGYEKGHAEALLISGAGQYLLGSEEKSDSLIRMGIAIAKKINEKGLYGYGLTQLAINFQYDDHIDSAFAYLNRGYEVLKDSLHPYYLSRVYFGLAECYRLRSDFRNELVYLKRCLKIREILGDESVTWLFVRMSDYYTEQGSLATAEQFLDRAQRYFGKDTVDNETISDVHAQRAVLFFKKGDYGRALNHFYLARKFYEKNSRKQKQVLLLYQIGRVFDGMGNYDLSLKNFFDAIAISDSNKYVLESIRINHAIGWCHLRMGQPHPAEQYVKKSLDSAIKYRHPSDVADALNLLGMISGSQNKNDEALRYYRQALQMRELQQDRLKEATTLLNIGTIYEKLEKLDSSLMFQKNSLALREKSGNEIAIANSYELMGRLYRKLKNFPKADEYVNRAELLARRINVGYVLLNVYQTKRDLLTAENRFEQAVHYSRLFENLRDSIFTNHLRSRLGILENIYNLREKEKEIFSLNEKQELQQNNLKVQAGKIRLQSTIIVFGISILLLVVAIAIVIFRYYRKVRLLNQEIVERNEEIEAQSEELIESNHQLGGLNDEIRQQKKEIEIQSTELAKRNETISRIN